MSELQESYLLDPDDPTHWDLRFGLLASLTVNVNRQKGKRAVTPADFFPSLGDGGRRPGERMTGAEIHEVLGGVAAAWDAQRGRR